MRTYFTAPLEALLYSAYARTANSVRQWAAHRARTFTENMDVRQTIDSNTLINISSASTMVRLRRFFVLTFILVHCEAADTRKAEVNAMSACAQTTALKCYRLPPPPWFPPSP